jgi:Skp family chaperone for outer membrane proteins
MRYISLGLAIVLTVVVVRGFGPASAGDQKTNAIPQTSIAIINVEKIIKNHPKYGIAKKEINDAIAMNQAKLKEMKQKEKALQADLKKAIQLKDPIAIQAAQKAYDEMNAQADAMREKVSPAGVAKVTAEKLQGLHKEVELVVAKYATAHNISLVLSVSSDSSKYSADKTAVPGSLTPIYSAPGVDITNEVLKLLTKHDR